MASVEEAYNFKAIDTAVATAGVLSPAQLAVLGKEGYEAVINLLPVSSDYAVAGEERIVVEQGIAYHYLPVDFAAPSDADYAAFVRAVDACAGKRVLIHCAANYRVSAFYAIYAHEHLSWSASRARAHIESIWNPAEHPPWDRFVAARIPAN